MDRIYLARPLLGTEELEAIKSVFDSGFLTEGRVTQELEKAVASYVGAKYGIATTSCTAAMYLALQALDVAGREVVVSDFTHPATIDAIILARGKPVLVDVDIGSRNVTAKNVEEAIGKETKCIVPVSLFGNPLETEVFEIARSNDHPVVEDAACSMGAVVDGKHVGSFADATCFSFHPRKIITTGEGGLITTDREDLAEACRSFKCFGSKGTEFASVGTNLKFPDVLAAIGLKQMGRIEEIIKIRAEKAQIYAELLRKANHVNVPLQRKKTRHTFQTYTIYFTKPGLRDRVKESLAKQNIESQIASYAIHLQPAFRNLQRIGDLMNSKLLYERALALPLHHQLSQHNQDRICEIVAEVANSF